MKPNDLSLSMIVAASVGALSFSYVAAQPAEPLRMENTQSVSATVESIDKKARLLELRSGDDVTTVAIPEEVRNFEQLQVGDQVAVSYYEAIGAQFKKKGESKTVGRIDVAGDADRAAPGARPGGVAANTVTTTVVIEAVDRSSNEVTFTGPAGMTRTVQVMDPEARQFIGTLKQGDEVELTYTEALAVTVEPEQR